MKNTPPFLLLCCLLLPGFRAWSQCFDCGDGTEGAFNATSNTTITGGLHNYSSFAIAPGITVRVTGSQPLQIKCTGAVSISGTLDVSGLAGANGVTFANGGLGAIGVAGGGNGGDGSFSTPNGPLNGAAGTGAGSGAFGADWSGGGGAGYAAVGASSGGVGGAGGPIYGNAQIAGNTAGSGGGGGSGGLECGAGGGGAGGGFVYIGSCVAITITGTINANGGNGGSDGTGNCGGGGGGSGGSIWLAANQITHNGSLTAIGGSGGASNLPGSPYFGVGGAGSVGRIRIDSPNYTGSGTVSPGTGFQGQLTYGPEIDSIAGHDVLCFGGVSGWATVSASGGTGTLTYSWSPSGGTDSMATGLAAGCYSIMVTDSLGCTDTDSICIAEPPVLTVSISTTPISCHGACDGTATATVTGGTPPYQYLWTPSGFFSGITNVCAGYLDVQITDHNSCYTYDQDTLEEPLPITLAEVHTNATAGNNNGTATVFAAGGVGGYSYLWNPGGMTTDTVSGLAPGVYTVSVSDSSGCVGSIQIEILALTPRAEPQAFSMNLFPNPAHDQIQLLLDQPEQAPVSVEWFDMLGVRVRSYHFEATVSLNAKMDLSGLAAGTYLCRITSGNTAASRKVTLK